MSSATFPRSLGKAGAPASFVWVKVFSSPAESLWIHRYFTQGCGVTYLGLLPGGKVGLSRASASTTRSYKVNGIEYSACIHEQGLSGTQGCALPLLFSWWRNASKGGLCGPRRQVLAPPGPTRTFLYSSLIIWTLVQANSEWWEQELRELYPLICTSSLSFNLCIYTRGWDGRQIFPQAWEDEGMLDGRRVGSFELISVRIPRSQTGSAGLFQFHHQAVHRCRQLHWDGKGESSRAACMVDQVQV